VFTFALVDVDGESYGPVVFAKRDWWLGELTAPGTLRVVGVIKPERAGHLPVLVVEPRRLS
jgi:hypothetical protein